MNKGEILRLSGVIEQSIVDGPGLRYVVFTQGCRHNCVGCHNPETHDFDGGYDKSIEDILADFRKNPLLKGMTFSGGEPFEQAAVLSRLAEEVKGIGKDIITYSGYTFEQLLAGANEQNSWRSLLERADFLVDGKFEIEQKTLMLPFRGSKNQRYIDVKKSLKNNEVVEVSI